jgi:CBS domain-containing protein
MTAISIGEICNKHVEYVTPETTVLRAAQLMRELHVGDLVIVDEDDGIRLPVGIVTDRDIVVAAVAGELDLRTLAVGDLSMYPLVTVGADLSVQEVVAEMHRAGVRRVPVVSSTGSLVGIVTFDDLVWHIAGTLFELAELPLRQRSAEKDLRS